MTGIKIDLTVTQEQVDSVVDHLKKSEEVLPGLIELTPEQRKSMAH